MGGERRPGAGSVAGDDIENALRESGLQRERGQTQCGERRLFRRFQHDAAAGGEGRADLPDRHQQWKIPRNDRPDHADRLAPRVGEEFIPAKAGHRDVDRGAFDLGRPTGAVAEEVHRRRNVDALRDHHWLAVVERFDLGKFDRVRFQQIGELEEPPLAIDRACRAPFTGLECRARRPHGEIDVAAAGRGNRGDHLAGRGIANVEPGAGERVAPLAADQHLAG
jgi:ParB family chromosome partitioning protein